MGLGERFGYLKFDLGVVKLLLVKPFCCSPSGRNYGWVVAHFLQVLASRKKFRYFLPHKKNQAYLTWSLFLAAVRASLIALVSWAALKRASFSRCLASTASALAVSLDKTASFSAHIS
jgi:hypothetical protein